MAISEDTTEEEWRPVTITGFESAYSVSSMGRVRRDAAAGNSGGTWAGRILKGGSTVDGYRMIVLSYGGRRLSVTIHKLVSRAFLGELPAGMVVDHEKGNKGDNRAQKLRFLSPGDNTREAARLGLMCRGNRCHSSVLQDSDVRAVRKRAASGEGLASIARGFGITPRAVKKIVLRLSWKHVD